MDMIVRFGLAAFALTVSILSSLALIDNIRQVRRGEVVGRGQAMGLIAMPAAIVLLSALWIVSILT